jgi:hypothetical protein
MVQRRFLVDSRRDCKGCRQPGRPLRSQRSQLAKCADDRLLVEPRGEAKQLRSLLKRSSHVTDGSQTKAKKVARWQTGGVPGWDRLVSMSAKPDRADKELTCRLKR